MHVFLCQSLMSRGLKQYGAPTVSSATPFYLVCINVSETKNTLQLQIVRIYLSHLSVISCALIISVT